MVTRASILKFRSIDMTWAEDSDQAELELKLQAKEHGREPRLEKDGTADIIEPLVPLVVLIRLHAG